MAFRAMKPPMDNPHTMALPMCIESMYAIRSSANRAMLKGVVSSAAAPNPRMSSGVIRYEPDIASI